MKNNDVLSIIKGAERYLKDTYGDAFSEEGWRAQRSVMEPLLGDCNSNVLGILPTGTGKSFIYQYYAHNTEGTVLVIEPLNAIINDQVHGYNREYGNGAFHLKRLCSDKDTEITSTDINATDPDLIFTSPETLYNSSIDIIECFTKEPSHKISMIVIDEVHTLLDWGLSFRDDYLFVKRFIREIRDYYDVRILLLTATLSRMQQEYLKCYLNMDIKTVPSTRPLPSVDRVNKVLGDCDNELFRHIMNNIAEKQEEGCTLFFFNTTKSVEAFHTKLYGQLEELQKKKYEEFDEKEEKRAQEELKRNDEYATQPITSEDMFLFRGGKHLLKRNEYHKGITSFQLEVTNTIDKQATIINFYGSMTPEEKDLRLNAIRIHRSLSEADRPVIVYVLTTKALSMGIDIDVVSSVVNAGLPDSMSEYKQEIGRIRNPDENTVYNIYCSQDEILREFNRLLPSLADNLDILSTISLRMKIWDFISLWRWYIKGKELPDISLSSFLSLKSDQIYKTVADLYPEGSDKRKLDLHKRKIDKLFGKRINKNAIIKNSEKTHPRFLMHTSDAVLSVFGIENGNYKCTDQELDFFDYIVFNSLFTFARENQVFNSENMTDLLGSGWEDTKCNNTLAEKLLDTMTGSLPLPRRDKVNRERDEIINRIDLSLDKLFDCSIEYIPNKKVRKLIDTNDFSFPLTDSLKKVKIIGYRGSTIGNAIKSESKKAKVTLSRLIAVHYTLLKLEMSRRFFFVEIKNEDKKSYRNTSYKVPYFAPPVNAALCLEDDTHYHKYQVPDLFEKYMKEALVALYKEESLQIKGRPFYSLYKNKEPKDIYLASAQGAYGLLDKDGNEKKEGTEKARQNYEKDIKDNLIINRYWLRDNGKLKDKSDVTSEASSE